MGFYGANYNTIEPPNGAVYLRADGDDHADGTVNQPVKTLREALKRVPDYGWVAVYERWVFRECGVTQPNKNVTIAALPGQLPLFRGSDDVFGWEPHAEGIWKRRNWVTNFSHVPADPAMVDPDNPMAPYPEQVWWNNKTLKMAATPDVLADEFHYDAVNRVMYIGNDPDAGVRIAKDSWLLRGCQDKVGKHPSLNMFGLQVSEWGTESKAYGIVVLYGHNSQVANCFFERGSAAGLFVQQGRGIQIDSCDFAECGQLGLHGYRVEDLVVSQCVVEENNLKGFDSAGVAGGLKVDSVSKRLKVLYCYVARNKGHGVWADLHCNDSQFSYNQILGHVGYAGLFFEMGYGAKIVSNWGEGNTYAVLVSEAGGVEVAYNTFVNNTKHVRVQRGPRPDDPNWFPYTHPQVGYDIHSNLYVQNVVDQGVTFNAYEDMHGGKHNWQAVGWEADYNYVRRVYRTGNAAVLTTNTNQKEPFKSFMDLRDIGHEIDGTEIIAEGVHSTDSVPEAGRLMSNEVQEILGVTDEEAANPNSGWYGPVYEPDPEPENPEEPMTISDQLHQLANEVAELELANATLSENLADAQASLAECEAELVTANETIAARDQTITQLNEQIGGLDEEIEDLEGQLTVANERIAELEAAIAECDCPDPIAGREARLAPLRGTHRLGWHAKPGTLAAYQSVQNIVGVDAPGEGRRVFLIGDTDFSVDVAAGRVPYVEVPIGGDYQMFADQAASLAPAPVILTVGHEEERPEKNNTATWFKNSYETAFPILATAPNAIITHTWMNQSLRGNTAGVVITEWFPDAEITHALGADVYVGNPLNLPFNSHENVLKPMLQHAYNLGVPLVIGEFGVGGPMQQRAAWVVGFLQWVEGLKNGSITYEGMNDLHLYMVLLSNWYHSNSGGNPPMTFDGTVGWEIDKASDVYDTQTPAIWKYGILTNGA